MGKQRTAGKYVCGKIRDIRKSLKLTQAEFAEIVNISEDSVGKIEREITVPTVDTIFKIAKALKLPITDLLPAMDNPPAKQSNALNALTSYLRTCSNSDIEFVHELAVLILRRK